ncbi:MAG: Acetyl esterase/lipase [Gammaproteobacteria bacterium]|nr:Acetyl esterase/lipase [Gammaproteobacteria bacterium]
MPEAAAPTPSGTETALLERAVGMFVAATPPVGAPIGEWRAGFERLCGTFEIPSDATFEEFDAAGVRGLKVCSTGASAKHVIIHFHSGGYVMGSSTAYRNFAARLSRVTQATVLIPDYRLAPEHPYPAALQDAVTVCHWCTKSWDPARLIISGDSAGGGLAIGTLLALRDAGVPLPAAGVAISPLLDLAGEGDSMRSNAGIDPLIDRKMVVDMGKLYIGDIDPHDHPLASPLWGKHHGLPPLLLLASASEVLRDDAVRLADSVIASGGNATVSLPPGMVHIWTLFPFLSQATHSMQLIGNFVRERWSL